MSLLGTRRLLRTLAESEDEAEISRAAQLLSENRDRYSQRGLERLLRSHESPTVRAKCAWALGFHRQGQAAADALLRALRDRSEEPDVRAHAAEALGHMADRLGERRPDVLAALLHALTEAVPEVRFWAAFALGNLGDEAAIPALERLAARDTASAPGWWSIRKEALDSIEQILLIKGNRDDAADVDES